MLSKGITLEVVLGELPSKKLFLVPAPLADEHIDMKDQLGQSFQPSTLESEMVILRTFFSKHSTGQTGQRLLCPQLASETELTLQGGDKSKEKWVGTQRQEAFEHRA